MARKQLWDVLDMPSRLNAVKGWAMNGSTEKQMMEWLGISRETFYEWKREKSEFADALKKGRHDAIGDLMNSVHDQTQGYYVYEEVPQKITEQVESYHRESGEFLGMREVERYITVSKQRYIPPSAPVSIFTLKNRAGWRDQQEVITSEADELSALSDDELLKRQEQLRTIRQGESVHARHAEGEGSDGEDEDLL